MHSLSKLGRRVILGIDRANTTMGYVGLALLIILSATMVYDVFMRYVLNSPAIWSLEVAMGVQLFLAFLCAGYVLKEEGHIRMEVIIERISQKKRALFLMVTSFIAIGYCGIMAYYSWLGAQSALKMTERTMTLETPVFFLKVVVPLGFLFFGFQFIVSSYKYYQQSRGK